MIWWEQKEEDRVLRDFLCSKIELTLYNQKRDISGKHKKDVKN